MESANSSRLSAVIVVNDFRAVPVSAAIQLAINSSDCLFLVSKVSLSHNDFGDDTSDLQKRLRIAILRLFARVELVPPTLDDYEHPEYHGLHSSLISMTRDVMATPSKYPSLAEGLRHLVAGSLSVLRRIRELDPDKVYVFNGRIASSQPIASELKKSGEREIKVYEWGGKFRRTFLETDYPLHDTVAEAARLAKWAEARNFEFDVQRAETYIEHKLNYMYELSPEENVTRNYRTVIFAGSPHEHAVVEIDNLSALDGDTFSLVDRCLSLGTVKLPAALRLHPNMMKDPSIQIQISRLREFLSRHEIDLIPPTEKVSAQELIEGADRVIVGNSSVGLDAIFLGKPPLIVGHPPYKDLVEIVEREFPRNPGNPYRIAGLLDAYQDPHVRNFGAIASVLWLLFRALDKFARWHL